MNVIEAALFVIVAQLTVICWHLRFLRDEVKELAKEREGNEQKKRDA